MPRRFIALLSVILALSVVAYALAGCGAKSSPRTLTIGAVYPTTGPQGQGGTEELRGENEKALTHAAGAAAPRPEDVFANVYKDPPPRVLRQRAELVDGSGG